MKIIEPTAKDGKPAPGDAPGRGTGSRKWAIWLVLSLAYLIVYFQRVSPAVIVDRLFAQFQIEAAAAMGSLAAIYFYAYFLMQIPASILNDTQNLFILVQAGRAGHGHGSYRLFGQSGRDPGHLPFGRAGRTARLALYLRCGGAVFAARGCPFLAHHPRQPARRFSRQQAFQYAFGACFVSCCIALAAVSLLRESFKR